MKTIEKLSRLNKKNSLISWLLVIVFYLFISAMFMGDSFINASSTVLKKPGDHTAGIIYTTWVHPDTPLPEVSNYTNYPFGENLRLPVVVTSQVLSISHWFLSKIAGVVTGWNLLVLLGYMSNALLMYGFVRHLTKNSVVGLFAGYAVAFTPYHFFASTGQIAGMFGSIFILVLWIFVSLWEKPTILKAIGLGSTIGIAFYADGYYILIGLLLLLSLWVATLSYYLWLKSARTVRKQMKYLGLATVVSFIFLLPVIYIQLTQANKISSILGNARGDIESNAQLYSAQISMYFNPTSLLFIGYVIAILASFYAYNLRKNIKKNNKKDKNVFYGWAFIVVAFIALITSLQPTLHFLGLKFYSPSKIIISLTTTWRVFGRLYIVVSISLILLASLGLVKIITKYPQKKIFTLIIVFTLLVTEMSIYPIRNIPATFNYSNAPEVYRWLKDNSSVRGIAEYPIDEPFLGLYQAEYLTYQQISNKPMVNTFLPNILTESTLLRKSIVGINDPQTLPVLRALGVDLINIRNIIYDDELIAISQSAGKNINLEKIFSNPIVDSYLLKPGPVALRALVIDNNQYETTLTNDGSATYKTPNDINLRILTMPGGSSIPATTSISISVSSDIINYVKFIQNGQTLWEDNVGPKPAIISFQARTDSPISINMQQSGSSILSLSKLRIIE